MEKETEESSKKPEETWDDWFVSVVVFLWKFSDKCWRQCGEDSEKNLEDDKEMVNVRNVEYFQEKGELLNT